jgi:hypothetical protein
MGDLREQFRLPSNQRAAVRVSIAHQISAAQKSTGQKNSRGVKTDLGSETDPSEEIVTRRQNEGFGGMR